MGVVDRLLESSLEGISKSQRRRKGGGVLMKD
jgi:hypothetical protein